jgi:hypothetical protein
MTTTDIHTLIAQAAGTIPADAHQRLTTAGQAIAANPALSIRDLVNILRKPAPVPPAMTDAQWDRLTRICADADAAGSTIAYRVTDSGSVLVDDTYDGKRVTAVIDRDGNLDL